MPKILINEKDYTNPGVTGQYANYAVLIAGFRNNANVQGTTKVQPDSYGVYELSSKQDFDAAIGKDAPEHKMDDGTIVYHYGNQMAYELLNLGYPIVFKPIENISELGQESFWAPFKDKVSYDFRFIAHGLLESSTGDDIRAQKTALESKLAIAVKLANRRVRDEAEDETNDNPISFEDALDDELQKAYGRILTSMDLDPEESDIENGVFTISATNYESLDKGDNGDYRGFVRLDTRFNDNNDEVTTYTVPAAYHINNKTTIETLIDNDITNIENEINTLIISDTGLINAANSCIANLAMYSDVVKNSGRGDCIALIELAENSYTTENLDLTPEERIIEALDEVASSIGDNGAYCALTVPSVYYDMSSDDKFNNNKFPGAFHYLACFMNSLRQGFAEWYAAAGYNRGVSSYAVERTSVKLGEIAINALEPRFITKEQTAQPKFACNVIANFRGNYYLWGNRTALILPSEDGGGNLKAGHFLNIRQLCTTIKKQLYVACRRFTFDPNSDELWVNFKNAIRPTLESMKADQGIRDYKIIKVYEENPNKATLKAKIRIIPIEAVEDFDLEVSLEDSFGETAVNATESI